MKVFVSGQIDDSQAISQLMSLLKAHGHVLTHDWTATDRFLGGADSKLANLEESGERAVKDIQGVLDSDVYILSSDNENVGKGMYVELGAALALQQASVEGAPLVYVIGKLNHLSIFYLHPLVRRRNSLEEVLGELSCLAKARSEE